MLSFVVFDPEETGTSAAAGGGVAGTLAHDFPLRHAYLFGADDIATSADISIEGGVIRCEKKSRESAGLALQFPIPTLPANGKGGPGVPGVGSVVLQTCLLPERERPYLLSLELARHRLMLVFNKLEDWALFDLPADDPGVVMFEVARRAFTEALVKAGGKQDVGGNGGFTAEDERLARRALALAVEASELLAATQASVQYGKRMSGELSAAAAKITMPTSAITEHETAESRNALIGSVGVILPTPPQIGCSASPAQFSPALCKAAGACCDFLSMPMRWVDMEPTEGRYLFGQTDRWIEWAVRTAKLPVCAGPIIDFRRGSAPEWLYIWEHDYETLRELVYEHVKTLVTRYRRTIGTWTVCGGLHVTSNFTLSLEQVMDLTRLCVMVVRKLQPAAKVQVQIDQPWGEYYAASSTRAIPPVMYADMMGQAGINPDLIALRVEMGQPERGRATRDMMAFSALLDRFAALDRPIAISALSAPSREPDAEDMGLSRQHDPGYWRKPWSEDSQARWLAHMAAVAASKPYVHSICWSELYDAPKGSDTRHDGLIDPEGKPKPALAKLTDIRLAVKEKRPLISLVDG